MKISWWQQAVVYQVYPRSFQDSNNDGIGDLRGLIQRLDYIQQLGVDVIWLNPIYESPNDDNGYDISNYQRIQPEFGSFEDFRDLIKAIHQRGMKLMMDLVVNHTSDEHTWFIASRKNDNNPFSDFYIWRQGVDGHEPNNWRSEFGGSAWQYDSQRGSYYLHLFTKKQPDLNWTNPQVRKHIYSMMDWWCQEGIDGFRMDVINLISKAPSLPDDPKLVADPQASSLEMAANGPKVHEYLREMNHTILRHHDLITVGETPGATPADALLYAGNDSQELQMVFQFEHMQLENDSAFGKWTTNRVKLSQLKHSLSRWQNALSGRAWNSLYWNNHDQPRVVSRFGNDSPQYRQLSAKMLANTLHMLQGTPYIYQGEEIGMTNVCFNHIDDYRDVEIKNAYQELVLDTHQLTIDELLAAVHYRGRDNARTPMQWNDSNYAGFTTAQPWIRLNPNYRSINVTAALQDPNSIFYFYKHLIKLRKTYTIITTGTYHLFDPDDEEVFMYERINNTQHLLVVSNFTAHSLMRPIISRLGTHSKVLISNYPDPYTDTLRPYETRTYMSDSVVE